MNSGRKATGNAIAHTARTSAVKRNDEPAIRDVDGLNRAMVMSFRPWGFFNLICSERRSKIKILR
jgi:hypothetical protein